MLLYTSKVCEILKNYEEFNYVFADVIERLNVLRGRGMASMYSWSSKRYLYNCLDFIYHFFCSFRFNVLLI
jgi:hypothetical protein